MAKLGLNDVCCLNFARPSSCSLNGFLYGFANYCAIYLAPPGGPTAGSALGHSSDSPSNSELFRHLLDSIKDYAIILLSPEGHVLTWNLGAEAMMGYSKQEILGTHFSKFYLPEDIQSNLPMRELAIAERDGRFAGEVENAARRGSQDAGGV